MKRCSKLLCFIVVFVAVMAAFCTMCFAANIRYTENLIPTMTSNTAPSGVCNASGVWSGHKIYSAFDHKLDSKWGSNTTTGWISYEFSSAKKICKYTITGDFVAGYTAQSPKAWTFEGSNDGITWTKIDERSNQVSWIVGEKRVYEFANKSSYLYYKLNFTSNNGHANAVSVTEIEMMEAIVPTSPTNLTAVPGNAKVELSWDAVEGVTSYIVKRSQTLGGPYQTISITTTGAITYQDIGLYNGKTYYYVVSAVSAGGESPNSNEVPATPTAPQPTNQLKVVLEVKEEKLLSVSEELSDNNEMDWTTTDSAIATVDTSGKVKALKPGNTVITCTSKDKSYTEKINVLVVDLAYQLAVDLNVVGTCRLTIDDLKNTTYVTWTSYDPTIATVSAKGKVTAVSEGLTYVIASDKDGKEIGRIYIRVR